MMVHKSRKPGTKDNGSAVHCWKGKVMRCVRSAGEGRIKLSSVTVSTKKRRPEERAIT